MESRINIMDIPVDDVTFVRKLMKKKFSDNFYVDVAIYVIVDIHHGCRTQPIEGGANALTSSTMYNTPSGSIISLAWHGYAYSFIYFCSNRKKSLNQRCDNISAHRDATCSRVNKPTIQGKQAHAPISIIVPLKTAQYTVPNVLKCIGLMVHISSQVCSK